MLLLLSVLGILHLLCAPTFSLRQPSDDYYGDYGPYGECSRTCGTGVAMRTRTCITQRTDGGHNCVGPSRSYKICNTQECPSGSRDFREEQCSQFDRRDFQGKRYTWLPYYGGANPCELVCVPRGENFYYRHRPAVVDGTPCHVGRSDICVEGVCRTWPYHINSNQRDLQVNSKQRSVYSYGQYSECSVSCGGGYQTRTVRCVMGNSAEPHVVDDSYCVSHGLQRPAAQQACNYHPCTTTVSAEYSVSSYSVCSVTCGEGRQTREVFCVGARGERLAEHACSGLTRPADTQTCRRPACQLILQYYVGDWSLCTRSCGSGTRERRVACLDMDQNQYEEARCASQVKPHTVESCNTQPCPGAQMVPSVQDPTGHESSLRGFVPFDHMDHSDRRPHVTHATYDPYTPVIGPHCAQSYYGCCPDGHTSATGPHGEGCVQDCVRTRFGCCLDGVTAALGFGRAGCPDYTLRDHSPPQVHSADVCSMARDAGSCYNWTARFYYDSSSGSCNHFWYGGCQGNGNNFASREECHRTCGGSRGAGVPRRGPTVVRRQRLGSYRARA
ncbi:papilin b, proteoglycan-like sulfated glycoprotein [Chanos chanos]|uniref:Papilin b, proteoglycan-like sulfated glycoprotein n=1 Tax=Chanos chanos TaxID=29144 RepID=A0A6J2V696_CHACN|nr:papilin-like [Chanos chanos]